MQQKSHARRPNIPKMRILTGTARGQGEYSPQDNDSMGKSLEQFCKKTECASAFWSETQLLLISAFCFLECSFPSCASLKLVIQG